MKLSSGLVIGFVLFFTGCGGGHGHSHELQSFAITQWTERTELFAEHRALVAQKETSFAVHLTDLKDFSAMTEGKVSLIFKDNQGEQIFTANAPTNPGIFRPIAKLSHAGKYHLTLTISGPFEDKHEIGEVEVYANLKSAPEEGHEEEQPEGITFLKEQQWKGGFNIEEVKEKELSEMILTQGQIRAPLIPSTAVTAPASGKLIESASGFPLLGSAISKDQVLAEVHSGSADKAIPIPSPISGIVSVVHAAPGDSVEEGRKLFDLIDTNSIWVEARVYEPDVPKLNQGVSALIEISETSTTLESEKLVSIGGTLDTVSRTTPIVFEVKNENGALKIGSSVRVHIRTKKSGKGTVIPVSALVDEDGKMVAYVQLDGEAFEKRELKLGIREGNFVQVLDGIKPGERVVTEGAYSIRLMSLSSQIPAHGHAH